MQRFAVIAEAPPQFGVRVEMQLARRRLDEGETSPRNLLTLESPTCVPVIYFTTRKGHADFRDGGISREEERRRKARAREQKTPRRPRVHESTDPEDTIDVPLENLDTLAKIQSPIASTLCRLRLTEIGRSDVKLSQVDPGVCQFRIEYCNIVRQHRIRHGRFSVLGD
ncbi:hypothetical protein KM043_005998 [Ampulex compressa]|nr:hypothetical protein KM043_005998 [Ampulex compressa]